MSLLLGDPVVTGPVEKEQERKILRGYGGGLDGGAQACSFPRGLATVPEETQEPGDRCAFGSHLATPQQPG